MTKVIAPFERPDAVVWYPDGRFIVFGDASDVPGYRKVLTWTPGIDSAQQLPLPHDPRCERFTEYLLAEPLPDGRLGFVEWCASAGRTIPEARGESYLVAYDWDSGTVEQIVDGPLLDPGLSRNFTWNPDMTRGVQEMTGLLGTLYWISPSGIEPMEVTVSDGKRSWSLAENIRILRHPDPEVQLHKIDVGIATAPAWSPDGKTIAYFATLDAVNRDGPARANGEYRLYLMSPDSDQPKSVLRGIYYPVWLDWSPDSRWLAFLGRAGTVRREGLWLFEPVGQRLVLVAAGTFGGTAWSPVGREIAAIHCFDDLCRQTEVVKYDVSHLVSEEG